MKQERYSDHVLHLRLDDGTVAMLDIPADDDLGSIEWHARHCPESTELYRLAAGPLYTLRYLTSDNITTEDAVRKLRQIRRALKEWRTP